MLIIIPWSTGDRHPPSSQRNRQRRCTFSDRGKGRRLEREEKEQSLGYTGFRMDIDGPDSRYDMGHKTRGIFLIINNKTFQPETEREPRDGTDLDAKKLNKVFEKLGFHVRREDNLTCQQMDKVMQEVAALDHSNMDAFGCAVLTHGADHNIIYGTDGVIPLDMLVEPIRGDKCSSLVGKPKLFFVQACRGFELDEGTTMSDAPPVEQGGKLPLEADILFAYSTAPGYFAWRRAEEGSWFIQTLCEVFDKYGHTHEIMSLLTHVGRVVAQDYETHGSSEPCMDGKKQMPSVTSQLTKQLYFTKK